jgi:hypothetical protein
MHEKWEHSDFNSFVIKILLKSNVNDFLFKSFGAVLDSRPQAVGRSENPGGGGHVDCSNVVGIIFMHNVLSTTGVNCEC